MNQPVTQRVGEAQVRRLAVLLAAVSLLLAAATLVLRWLARGLPVGEYWVFNACVAVGFGTAGAVIATRRSGNVIGWLFLAGGIGNGITGAATTYAAYALGVHRGQLPGWQTAFWVGSWTWVLVPTGMILTLALFPDGRPLSRRWRPVVWLAVVASGLWVLSLGTCRRCPTNGLPTWIPRDGPLPLALSEPLLPFGPLLLNLAGAAAVVSLVLRDRRGSPDERQQLKWLALAAAPLVATFIVFIFGTSGGVWLSTAAVTLFAIPVAVAVLKYRLYEIDVVLNRALVYVVVSFLLWGLWVVVVVAAGRAVTGGQTIGVPLLATGLVAVLALPARAVVQQFIDRVMYGRRRDPLGVITGLSRQLEAAATPEALLSGVVRQLGETLKLGHISVAVAGERPPVPYEGEAGGAELRLPLLYQGEAVGTLVVATRRGDRLSARDRRLLETLLPQLAVNLHAVRLRRDLQRSRERLVTALEEERRRLRRDLHDGVGPTLTAVALRADTIRNLLHTDLETADRLLTEARAEVTEAIAEIRRLVYDLRPPALDELGLIGALRQQARRFVQVADASDGRDQQMVVEVEAPEPLPPLPAAVEVAAYRIASEAITNAARHARATRCVVRITLDGDLDLEVTDDGRGRSSEAVAGVGLISMRERASELGGALTLVTGAVNGTQVHARLPLSSPQPS